MFRGLFAITAALFLVSAPMAARADVAIGCRTTPCTFDPQEAPFFVDYTIEPDGHWYRWDFILASAGPSATVDLDEPNQVETYVYKKLSDGSVAFDFQVGGAFVFEKAVSRPGLVSYLTWAPRDYDRCATSSPGDLTPCGETHFVWGNGTVLNVSGDAPVDLLFRAVAVPESATWAMLIVGFGAVGMTLRRQRRMPNAKPA